jgi:predicted DNA-binding transcriptional regulator YafY
MNRIDRLYALVEELRAAGPRGRTARQLAERFELSVRTIERDLSALGQAGVPLATRQGRTGGYTLDRSMSLPPLNFTPREAAAIAVALSRSEHVLFTRDARSALQKIVAAMPERALQEARATAEKVRLLVQRAPDPEAGIAETIWRAVRDNQVLHIHYIDVGGLETEREVEPQHVVVGPNGSYLTAGAIFGGTTESSGWIESAEPSRRRRCRARSASSRSRPSTATRRRCRSRRCDPKISCQTPT